ncbi:MAG: response regulator transcription factor [Bacteroidia bacterium]|nr:response regulator transcription factor [Bacteroidia bacterium]
MDKNELKILLVDDEADILEFLGYNLRREGYKVEKAKNGKRAIQIARQFKPHLVILDVMMPVMDGMETCTVMRNMPELNDPLIVFLTARGEDYSQIAGFEAGADDYITKPIKPKIFLSRIQALLRRIGEPAMIEEQVNDRIETCGFIIDKTKFVVIRGEEEISLPKKEFELLHFLASSPNNVVTREMIFSAVWGDDVVVGDRTIDVHIRRIRERLELDNIRTIKGVGYKFEAL